MDSKQNGCKRSGTGEISRRTRLDTEEPTYMNKKNGADSLINITFLSPNLALKAKTEVLKTSFDSDHFQS